MKSIERKMFVWSVFAVALVWAGTGMGATTTWTGASDSDWFNPANWDSGAPADGYDVVIPSGSVLLTNATADLASLTMNGGTLTFSNWSTKVWATNVSIVSNAQITLPSPFLNTDMSNRVWIVCTNFFLNSNASINVNGKGYAAVLNAAGHGPGGGVSALGGGGYGGRGSDRSGSGGGLPYGLLAAPESPGSAGHSDNDYDGGHGGGAVRIEAPCGNVTVNGTIAANGASTTGTGPWYGRNGSGGGIYITCRTFAGTNGTITADAGITGHQSVGGGGRIAVVYDSATQAAMPKPTVRFSAARGDTAHTWTRNTPYDIGAIYFPDAAVLNENWLPHTGQIWMASAAWNVNNLTVSNGWIRFPANGFQLTVTNSAIITGSGKLELGGDQVSRLYYFNAWDFIASATNGPTFSVGGNLALTNGGSLVVYAGTTNGSPPDYGALISVTGDIFIASNSWIYPHSHPTNGGSVLLRMNNLTVAGPVGGISADYRGFRRALYENNVSGRYAGFGPGGGRRYYTGGGYGGLGSDYYNTNYWGLTYGSSNAPVAPGSAGGIMNYGDALGGNGGGAIWIEATNTVRISGLLSANGQDAYAWYGGGSGGGIYITCRIFAGNASGTLRANGGGGGGYGGGGGGGRIAVWRVKDTVGGAVTATVSVAGGGSGLPPSPGTIVWGQIPVPPGTLIKVL